MTFDCTKINLKKGSKGEEVKELQKILEEKKYYNGKIDGDFGTLTEKAVKKLQKQQGNTQDGWFGPKTCNKLQTTHNKTEETKTTINKGNIIKTIEKVGGITVTGHRTLYQNWKKMKYNYYNNDIYTLQQELQRIQKGQGLNCTDHAQLFLEAYKEAGFTDPIRIVRGVVTCKSGKAFGHVWCQVQEDGKWVNVDPSAMAAHGSEYGSLICTNGYRITNINPAWAVSDDGIT